MAKYLTSGSILMLALASPAVAAPSPTFEKPRLVLQITVDQLRGDLPTRYFDRLGIGPAGSYRTRLGQLDRNRMAAVVAEGLPCPETGRRCPEKATL